MKLWIGNDPGTVAIRLQRAFVNCNCIISGKLFCIHCIVKTKHYSQLGVASSLI